MFVRLELPPADLWIGLFRFTCEGHLEVDPAARPDQLHHPREDTAVVHDVLEALDRVDEVGRRQPGCELWVEQVALQVLEVRQGELDLRLTKVDATHTCCREMPGKQRLVQSLAAADGKDAARRARALKSLEQVDPAEETQTPIQPEQPPAEVFLDPVWTGGV